MRLGHNANASLLKRKTTSKCQNSLKVTSLAKVSFGATSFESRNSSFNGEETAKEQIAVEAEEAAKEEQAKFALALFLPHGQIPRLIYFFYFMTD